MEENRIPVYRALLSVSDHSGLAELGGRLAAAGVELVASGGTAAALESAGLPVTRVESLTGVGPLLGGRVKTLHPAIHAGILADPSDPEHAADLEAHGIEAFQLVVVAPYPFARAVAEGRAPSEMIEQIDVGGPTMIRAAAKNHAAVGVVVSPDQYAEAAEAVEAGGLPAGLREAWARRAFFTTAALDAAIVGYLEGGGALPQRLVLPLERTLDLRYGENPHQAAAAYAGPNPAWWQAGRLLQGKALSFNNLADARAAAEVVHLFDEPAVVIVKHKVPCGVAVADEPGAAFAAAWDGDPVAAFGGVVALNHTLDVATAQLISERFVEVVVAPEVAPEAAAVLEQRDALRLLEAPAPVGPRDLRPLDGGFLAQDPDDPRADDPASWEHAAGPAPSAEMMQDLSFAWRVAAGAASNAIVIARNRATVGVGAGDQSRVGAVQRAVAAAGDRARGAVAASDGFFPFRDGPDALAAAGVAAVIEPGGSKRDSEVIVAAEEHGMTLVFTGRRHFRH